MDKMYIDDLEVYAHHGIFQEEKTMGQMYLVSLILDLDLRAAGLSDDLNATVNYARLCDGVTALLQTSSYNLIETCAELTANYVLQTYPMTEGVTVLLKKPWAPIGKSLNYAAVEIHREWHRVYLGAGSNMGDPKNNLDTALRLLESDQTKVLRVSSYYRTAPVSEVPQDDYLNCAAEIRTLLAPDELLDSFMKVEAALGRERTVRWGPRAIDLDILLYDHEILESGSVTAPHPRMHKRLFVLAPLCELAPHYVHPVLHQRLEELKLTLESSDSGQKVERMGGRTL